MSAAVATVSHVLELSGISKRFGAVTALDSIDLDVRHGEILGLLGQNGSGKSTLVKVLTGYHRPDSGSIVLNGSKVETPVRHPTRLGIVVIHQDLGLAEELSVLDNVGVTDGYAAGLLGRRRQGREIAVFQRLLERVGVQLDPHRLVRDLSPAERVFVAVVRALRELDQAASETPPLVLFDEPTALLSAEESSRLIAMMRTLARSGAGIIFITHRLAEVMATCQRAAVIRDGRITFTAETTEASHDDYIEAMLGRRLESYYPAKPAASLPEVTMRARGLSGRTLRHFDLTVHSGEIVGVTGLLGMGQEDIPLLLSGALPPAAGTVEVDSVRIEGSLRAAMRCGVALVPGDRRRYGVWLESSATANLTLPVVSTFFDRGLLRPRRETAAAQGLIRQAGVHPPIASLPMSAFSGGNQQKIVFAKWMNTAPRVIVLDEPTQGVDAGAKRELLEWIARESASGLSVVMVSGDQEQLAAMCHRVLILRHGDVVQELAGDDLTESNIVRASSGVGLTPAPTLRVPGSGPETATEESAQ